MSQGDEKKKDGVVIDAPQFRLANAGNAAKKVDHAAPSPAPAPNNQSAPAVPFALKAVAAAKAAVEQVPIQNNDGAERRMNAFRDLKNRQNMLDRSRRAILKARLLKLFSYLAICLSLYALSYYWEDLFPKDPAADAKAYHQIGAYAQSRRNMNRRVVVEGLRYDIQTIALCPSFCVTAFRDDHKNQIMVGFPRNKFYKRLKEYDRRVDVKGVLVTDKKGIPVLKVHDIVDSGGIDIYKIIGIE